MGLIQLRKAPHVSGILCALREGILMAVNQPPSDQPEIKYQGRKTARTGSEQRRRTILEAALRIVVKEGVRGIRHRSVAKEAGVPLAATTYYFKDIQELICDTFILYAEKARENVNRFAKKMYEPLENADGKKLAELTTGPRLVQVISEQLTGYVTDRLVNDREGLVIDLAFHYEAVMSEPIRPLAQAYDEQLESRLIEFLNLVHSSHPKEDAKMLVSTLRRAEYEALLRPKDDLNSASIFTLIERQVSLILKIEAQTPSQPY